MRPRHRLAVFVVVAVVLASCAPRGAPAGRDADLPAPLIAVPEGPLSERMVTELDALFSDPHFLSQGDLGLLGDSRDPRIAWLLVDMLRFHQAGPSAPGLVAALERLVGADLGDDWVGWSDLLLRAETPAPPGYLQWKRVLYLAVDDRWAPFFDDAASLDWRLVTWGGVFRDGIPALDKPPAVTAEEGDWLPDEELVFGVAVEDDVRAYPLRMLEVHEMVNDQISGQSVAVSYCTLCGSAIAYRADDVPGTGGPLTFRTSGLLQRSNKLMFDDQTESLFEQFTGIGVAGPLQGVRLEMLPGSLVPWGQWRSDHAATTILADDGGIGRVYDPDPLGDRDAGGPIFPVGQLDDRLEAHERVLGVVSPRGQAVAFPAAEARETLQEGRVVSLGGIKLERGPGAVVATAGGQGPPLPVHEAFWFAWSQFHPGSLLWSPDG